MAKLPGVQASALSVQLLLRTAAAPSFLSMQLALKHGGSSPFFLSPFFLLLAQPSLTLARLFVLVIYEC